MMERGKFLTCTKEELQTVINVEKYQKNVTSTVLVMVLDHKHQHVFPYQICLDLVVSTEVALFRRSQELKEKSVFKANSGKSVPSCTVSNAAVCSFL